MHSDVDEGDINVIGVDRNVIDADRNDVEGRPQRYRRRP